VIGRLSAIVVVLVMVGAPVSAALCQITCEEVETHDMAAMAAPVGHVHHARASVPTTAGTKAIHVLPHVCGDPSDVVVGVQQVPQSLDLLVAVTSPTSRPSRGDLSARPACSRVEHSPPGAFVLTSQLRV
jgi:hypothetical protein